MPARLRSLLALATASAVRAQSCANSLLGIVDLATLPPAPQTLLPLARR